VSFFLGRSTLKLEQKADKLLPSVSSTCNLAMSRLSSSSNLAKEISSSAEDAFDLSVSSTRSGLAGVFSAAVLDRSFAVSVSLREDPIVIPDCFRFRVGLDFFRFDFFTAGLASGDCVIMAGVCSSGDTMAKAAAATGGAAAAAAAAADVVIVIVETSASAVVSATILGSGMIFVFVSVGGGLEPGGGAFKLDALALVAVFFPALGLAFPTGRNNFFFFLVTFLEDTNVVIGSGMMGGLSIYD